MVRPAYNGRRR